MWNAYLNPFDVERNMTRTEIPRESAGFGPVDAREYRSEAYTSLLICNPPFMQPTGRQVVPVDRNWSLIAGTQR
jgi:hypothetical protein